MKPLFFLSLLFISGLSLGQGAKSIHQEELEKYNSLGHADAAYYEAIPNGELLTSPKMNCNLEKVVYGWHPYWVGTAYQNYQWDLLSHFSFFSYEVDASTGNALSTHGWSTSAAVDAALASGNTKVTLCVTLFSGHTTFFSSPTAAQTLITNLINLVQSRGAHGVNIDFEGIPSSQTSNFANFMVDLANQMHAAIPGSEVSTVLYAVDWNNVFDFSIMEPAVDQYIIMGYAYYYNGSSNAGPTDPLYHFGSTYNYTLSRTITYYLDAGCPAEKLVMGLPQYGYEWETATGTVVSPTTNSGVARTYAYVKNNSSGNYAQGNHQWVSDAQSDAYIYDDGVFNQCHISMDSAWRKRLDHINKTGIAGIGIWALGYDNGYTGLWNAMNDYLTDCHEAPCSGSIHDFGGPEKNYYNDEDYTWTIAPAGATAVELTFNSFDIENNYDYLYIYDGFDDSAPQIAGSPFTGTNSPGQFTTSTGAVTFRFYSDGATVRLGFLADYQCQMQAAPVASFSLSSQSVCLGDSIQLVDNSTDADSYNWTTSAGGLSSSTAEEPFLFPLTSGTYLISLQVQNAVGISNSSQTLQIEVYESPVAIADVNASLIGVGGTVGFMNASINASSYFWDFGDGSTSTQEEPWHVYSSPGTYTVILIAENGACSNDTTSLELTISGLGIEEIMLESIEVIPNPNNGHFAVVRCVLGETIYIYDQQGRLIEEREVSDKQEQFDLSHFAKGVYTLRHLDQGKRILVH